MVVRAEIVGPIKSDLKTYRDCCKAYGRSPSIDTWKKWRGKVLAHLDRAFLPTGQNTYATYSALMTVAYYLRGNEPGHKGKKLSRANLTKVLAEVKDSDLLAWQQLPRLLPDQMPLSELDKLIAEITPTPSRTSQWRAGVKRKQGMYDRWEVNQILRKLSHVDFRPIQAAAS